jgi:hypothetical protein
MAYSMAVAPPLSRPIRQNAERISEGVLTPCRGEIMPGEALTIRERRRTGLEESRPESGTAGFSWTFMVRSARWGWHESIPVDLICVK